ncbi:MAG: L-histidine N(alpha)-methyltransferase [Solirubrobacterales bacterium]
MEPQTAPEPIAIEVHLPDNGSDDLAADARAGLARELKELPPKYFYDERGSRLFERITELPEYYPTRTERAILRSQASEIVAAAGDPVSLIELGSGSAAKTRVLLDAMREAGCLRTYAPVDISEEITRATAERLVSEYPDLLVRGVVCDFERHLERVEVEGPRMIAFLGGTIGNFYPGARRSFLGRIADLLGEGDHLLLGTDLVKDTARLEAAYNDSAGVTAEFNKNVLCVLNRELGADFDLDRFEHRAFYDPENARVDLRLRSLAEQTVSLPGIGMTIELGGSEEIRTEISCKFTRPHLEKIYAEAGLEMTAWFTDPAGDFALSLARGA